MMKHRVGVWIDGLTGAKHAELLSWDNDGSEYVAVMEVAGADLENALWALGMHFKNNKCDES